MLSTNFINLVGLIIYNRLPPIPQDMAQGVQGGYYAITETLIV
jgi:hypothetical protein